MSDDATFDDERLPALGATVDELLASSELWAEPPSGLDDSIVAAISSEAAPFEPIADPSGGRSRGDGWRTGWRAGLLGAAAALVVLFGAVVVFSALDEPDDSDSVALDLVPTGLLVDAAGSAEMTDTDSGVRIELEAAGLPERTDGAYYEAWVRTAGGDLVPVGTFREGDSVVLWAGVPLTEVVGFTVTQEGVATIDDSGQESSGTVVLKADLPTGG